MSSKRFLSAILVITVMLSSLANLTVFAEDGTTEYGVTKTVVINEDGSATVTQTRTSIGNERFFIGEVDTENLVSVEVKIGANSGGSNVGGTTTVKPVGTANETTGVIDGNTYDSIFNDWKVIAYSATNDERTATQNLSQTTYFYAWVKNANVPISITAQYSKYPTGEAAETTANGVTKTVTPYKAVKTIVQASKSSEATSDGTWFYIGEIETENLEKVNVSISGDNNGNNVGGTTTKVNMDENGKIAESNYPFQRNTSSAIVNYSTSAVNADITNNVKALSTDSTVYLYAWVKNNDVEIKITAEYTQTYTVTWKNGDTVLKTNENAKYGIAPSYDGDAPAKDSTDTTVYTFSGWKVADENGEATGELITDLTQEKITANTSYLAQFTETTRKYKITFVDEDGSTILKAETEYEYGATVVQPETPTKAATDEYTYTFADWTPSVTTVSGDQIYKATFTEVAREYEITYNINGHGTAPTGEYLKYTAGTAKELPTLEDANYDFGGWYTDDETFNSTAAITAETRGNQTFYAKWTVKTYSVTTATGLENGSVTVNKSTASLNDEITVNISPETGYQLASLTVGGEAVTGDALTNAVSNNTYTFNMPAKAVEVSATFEKKAVDKVEITLDNSSATHGTAATINATAKIYAADNTDITSLYASDIVWSLDETTTTANETTISGNGVTATVSVGADQAVGTVTVTATVGGKSNNKAITVSSEPTYTITIGNSITGGTVTTTPSGSTTKGQSVTITATPNNGYQLKANSIKVNDGAVPVTNNTFTMPEGNVTVTAEFEQINYTITDNTNDAHGSLTISKKEGLHYGDSQTVIVVPAQGYELDTLTIDGVDVTASVDNNSYTIENITGNVTIAATFKKITYTVIITGGEGIENVKLGEKTGTKNGNIYTFTEVEGGEYTFDVTYTEGYEKAATSPTSITVSESKKSETISAQKKKYIVIFKIDGQSDTEEQVEHGSTAQSQAPQNPTKSGYHFVGWVKGTDTAAATVTTWDEIISNGTVYTAKFEENAPETVTVTFNAGDGIFADATKTKNVTINKGASLTANDLPSVTPPTGYTFNGWGEITGKAVNESVSYTAEYTIKSFTITWMIDENTKIDETTVEYNVTPTHADASKPTTDEYTYNFKGWTPTIVSATENATYTAQFDSIKRKYTITWNIDGAETNEELEYGATPSHANPTKAEDANGKYSFTGWSPAIETVSKAQTYTAQFDLIAKYAITYETDDGTINDSNYATVYYEGEGATLPTDVTKDGYTFAGWYDNDEFEGEAVTTISTAETGNKTYYANWTLNTPTEYLITFVNWDNTELQKSNVTVGTTPKYSGATPTKADDSRYTYEFIGWTPEIVTVSGIATYKAEFKQYVKPVNNAATIEKKTDANGTRLIVTPNDITVNVINLYAAIYNENGSLKRVEMTRCTKDGDNIIVPLTEPQLADGETYKLMLWDISYLPLIQAITSSDNFFN